MSRDPLDQPVASFGFSVRTRNCFVNAGIVTVRQLTGMTREDLLRIRQFGQTSLREVEKMLNGLGMSLAVSADCAPPRIPHAWSVPGPVGDLKKIRTRAGLTQSETAARMGVPASTFAAWENGQNEPSWQNLTMWAAALGWHLNHGFSPAAQQWTELPSAEQAAK